MESSISCFWFDSMRSASSIHDHDARYGIFGAPSRASFLL